MSKKRGNNEGSIWQRADGRWCAAITLGVVGGKKRRKVVYGTTRAEVAAKLKRLQAEQQQGAAFPSLRLTVAQFLAQWLEQSVKPSCRPRTYASYLWICEHYLIPHLGSHPLQQLAPSHVQAMLAALIAEALSPRTVAYARGVLQRALNRAIKWELLARNVAALAEVPRQVRPQIAPLTAEQVKALLSAVEGHRLALLYRLAVQLGLRKGEAAALRWVDVDWANAKIAISGTVGMEEGKLTRSEPKTAASVRTLPLSPALIEALRRHQQCQQAERAERGADWPNLGMIFPSEVGTLLSPRNLVRHFKAALKRAGLPSATRFHDLRHTCATLLISQGVHPRVVMELLGHSTISTTMDIYAHALPSDQRDASAKLDDLLRERGEEDQAEGEEDQPD